MSSIPLKTCSRCRNMRPATTEFFPPSNQAKSGLSSWCRECRRAYDRAYQRPAEKKDPGRTSKQCSKCKAVKPLQEFVRDPRKLDGHESRCKECHNSMGRHRYKDATPERAAQMRDYRKRYWNEHRDELIERQHETRRSSEEEERRRDLRAKREQRLRETPSPGYVYLLHSGGRYKIGRSKAPNERLYGLRNASPFPVSTICVAQTDNMRALEFDLHALFQHARKKGEWFELTDEDIERIKHIMSK